MKTGYSNVHGITVEAAEVDAQRCEAFQVVCPNCREFVFKALRRDGNRAIHYLSHYRSDPEANRECELRVAARFSGQPSEQDVAERERALHHYLECFSSMIDSMPMFQDPEKRRQAHARLCASKGATVIRKFQRDGLTLMKEGKAGESLEDFVRTVAYGDIENGDRGVFDEWDESRATGRYHSEPGFPRSMQVRVAADMLRTLLTKGAIPAWNELFSTAWMVQMTSVARHERDGEWVDYVKRLGPPLSKAIAGHDIRDDLLDLSRRPAHAPYMRYGGTWHDKLNVELMHSIITTLLEIDYARWSRAHADAQRPVEVAAELRAAAVARYEKDVEEMKAAGIDVSPEGNRLDREEVARETSRHLSPMERVQTALHMAISGEGVEYRHTVDEPEASYRSTPVFLVVRFAKASNGDYMPTFNTIQRDWRIKGQPMSPVPQTMIFSIEASSHAYGEIARKVDAITASREVSEATVLLFGDDTNVTALVADGNGRRYQMLMEQAKGR